MKKSLSMLILVSAIATAAVAQNSSKLSALFDNYIILKNALIEGDATKVGSSAAHLSSAINAIDNKALTGDEQKSFQPLQSKLASDAKLIADSKDINKQRETFATLSNNMISLAKAAKLSGQDIFVQYCPMKKAYWLSSEQVIKNPYYGDEMLDCGNLKETIKQ